MDIYLRTWRQEELNKGQHEAAIYIGDKVLALTSTICVAQTSTQMLTFNSPDDDSDAFWLAQVHFSNNNYTRALALLARKDLIARSLSCRYLAAHCYIKQGKYEQALSILGDENPSHLIASSHNARRKLAHLNGNTSRHVTLRNGKLSHRSDRIEYSEERERDRGQEKDIKFQAAMCYLRGLCFAKRNAFDRARECYKDAVRIDVQCFEAFDQLMKNSLMSPAEELAFLEELDFETIQTDDQAAGQEAAHFTKLLYTTRLSKYASPSALSHATETLSTHYNLSDNPDLLLTRAETLYTQCRFHEALEITSSILNSQNSSSIDSSSSSLATTSSLGHSPTLYPLHLACLYETASHNTLFLLSHTLSEHAPHEPYTYLAIGTYYLSTSRISEARRFFSKASLMDPHSPAAWIGFAHTFAAEGEHDQAIAAYSTAARLFQGSHLPQLFLGMQYLALNNMQLALEYCVAAYEMSSGSTKSGEGFDPARAFSGPATGGDPLVLNELGIILYHQSNLPVAVKLFKQSLKLAAELGCSATAWIATRANLAHALRRLGRLEEALAEFDECLRTATGGSLFQPSDMLEPGRRVDAFSAGSRSTAAALAAAPSRGSGAASGYDERNLLGSIHTSRGLVLLSMPSRTHEAVLALHEAVRVLGGDASGGGVAGTLLGRAVEIWALEESCEEEGTEHSTETKHVATSARGRRRRLDAKTSGSMGIEQEISTGQRVELGLDDDADEVLDVVMGRIKGDI